MGTQEVELERAGEKSAVDGSDPVCSFIHNIIHHNIIHNHLRPKSSHVTVRVVPNMEALPCLQIILFIIILFIIIFVQNLPGV